MPKVSLPLHSCNKYIVFPGLVVLLLLKEERQASGEDGQDDCSGGGHGEEESPSEFTVSGVELGKLSAVSLSNTLEVLLVPAEGPQKDGNSVDDQTEELDDGDEKVSTDVTEISVAQGDGTEHPRDEKNHTPSSEHDRGNLSEYSGDVIEVGVEGTSLEMGILREFEGGVEREALVRNTVAHHTAGGVSVHRQQTRTFEVLILDSEGSIVLGDEPVRHEEGKDAASYHQKAEGAPSTRCYLVHIHGS